VNLVRIALAALFVVLLALVAWQRLRGSAPSYQGRTLTAWLSDYSAADDSISMAENKSAAMRGAGDAIRNMGTNAVPHLLEFARAKDSILKRIIAIILEHQSIVRVNLRTDKEKRHMAVLGFMLLVQWENRQCLDWSSC
jgi:hypothetical protein